jgi:hypothetical protein
MSSRASLVALAAWAAMLCTAAPPAVADFGIQPGSFNTAVSTTQAGAHPDIEVNFAFNTLPPNGGGVVLPDENAKNVSVDLPRGLIGNPTALPRCPISVFDQNQSLACPPASQVGYAVLNFVQLGNFPFSVSFPVYNLVPPPGEPAEFGLNILGFIQHFKVRVRSNGDYGITTDANEIEESSPILSTSLVFWGVPADPSHDPIRGALCSPDPSDPVNNCFGGGLSAGIAPKPFTRNPTECTGQALTATLTASSWQGGSDTATSSLGPITGCDKLTFDPELSVQPSVSQSDSPTGLAVDLKLPQNDDPNGLATPDLRKAVVSLPPGLVVSPSGADGLEGCSDQEIALNSVAPGTCPAASKIGTAELHTPLLDTPLEGSVYLGTPLCNPCNDTDASSGRMLRMFIELEGAGVVVKLPGTVTADTRTGQLTATFDNNPQLPFDELKLNLKSGPRAPLATGLICGTFHTTARLTPWTAPASGPDATTDSIFNVGPDPSGAQCPASVPFAPTVDAGVRDPVAGSSSPFVFRLRRDDRTQRLAQIDELQLPPGLLASIKGIPQCSSSQAEAGTCDPSSQIGEVTSGAGPGSHPFYLTGKVFLTEGYKGAPFGLSIVVPAVAGPFNLGNVVVRAGIYVDPTTAAITVKTDPLPEMLAGIPLDIRDIALNIDRPGFMRTPTNCSAMQIRGTASSFQGDTVPLISRFQVGGCAGLSFSPKLTMRLLGRRQTADGGHPRLVTTVSQRAGQANIRSAKVALPLSLALDPNNSQLVCNFNAGLRDQCPASTIVGHATAVTPLLNKPLTGRVYLVQGLRLDASGRLRRTLPTLLIPLRGEIALDLRARTSVFGGKLVTSFPSVPDAPLSRFTLTISGGRKGILVVTHNQNLCRGAQVTGVNLIGQNGRSRTASLKMFTPCRRHIRLP